MIRNYLCSRNSLALLSLALLFAVSASNAPCQVSFPRLHSEPHLSVFGTFTDVKPDYHYYGDYAAVGFTVGSYMQTTHMVGFEARSSVMRWQGLEHEESALLGPRVALHFGHVSPYLSLLGGAANGWRWKTPRHTGQPEPKLVEGLGPQWSVVGGLDIHIAGHMVFRVGEVSYSKTYLSNWNLTPLTASAGFVYRLR